MLSPYARTQRLTDSLALVQSRLDLKLNFADTATMLAPYLTSAFATQNFVDLANSQTINGYKNFLSWLHIDGMTVSKNGNQSMAIGEAVYGGTANNVSAIGFMALDGNSGSDNTALGTNAMRNSGNTSFNTAIGQSAGSGSNTGGYNTFVGHGANLNTSNTPISNSVAIGYGAIVDASNKIQLGNSSVTAVNTSGDLTAKSFKKSGGTAAQFLKADGSVDVNTYLTSSSVSSTYLPLAGGTLTGTLSGTDAMFSSDITANTIKFGIGAGGVTTNLAIGNANFVSNTTGYYNIAIGQNAMYNNQTGNSNTVVGNGAVYYNTSSNNITALGWHALHAEQGAGNTAIGYSAGARGAIANTLTNSTFLGNGASAGGGTINNATAIGSGAIVDASNKIQLGNASVTTVNTSGNITAKSFIKSGGTDAQILAADGSVITAGTNVSISSGTISATASPIREVADEFTATAAQTNFTLTQVPSVNSKVRMYVNGIRISNTAYTVSGNTLTYLPANNGSYTLTISDRIQFDYFY